MEGHHSLRIGSPGFPTLVQRLMTPWSGAAWRNRPLPGWPAPNATPHAPGSLSASSKATTCGSNGPRAPPDPLRLGYLHKTNTLALPMNALATPSTSRSRAR